MITDEARLRREGVADAAVLLTAKKIIRLKTLDDWCRDLGVTDIEKQHAVRRLQQRAAAATRAPVLQIVKPRRPHQATPLQQHILDALTRAGGIVVDADGHTNSRIREALPVIVDAFRLSTAFKQLDDAGLIVRVIRGRRTYSIAIVIDEGAQA